MKKIALNEKTMIWKVEVEGRYTSALAKIQSCYELQSQGF